jgi:hypothetical protein
MNHPFVGADSPFDGINARVVFWTCPEQHPREPQRVTVEWETGADGKMTPRCRDCGRTGEPR